MEKYEYIESEDTLVITTSYDARPVIEANKAERNSGNKSVIGSKGQQMVKVASIDMDHIVALKNLGYNLLSPDPQEVKRALLYVQAMENDWMVVDGKPIADKKQVWL